MRLPWPGEPRRRRIFRAGPVVLLPALFLWGVAIGPFTGPGENQDYWALVPIAAMLATAVVWNVALIFAQSERDRIIGYAIYALVYIPAFAYAALMASLMILRAPL